MNFIRWLTLNGPILAAFIAGSLYYPAMATTVIYFIWFAIITSAIGLAAPTAKLQEVVNRRNEPPFSFKLWFDLVYDLLFICCLYYFGNHLTAAFYFPIIVLSISSHILHYQKFNRGFFS